MEPSERRENYQRLWSIKHLSFWEECAEKSGVKEGVDMLIGFHNIPEDAYDATSFTSATKAKHQIQNTIQIIETKLEKSEINVIKEWRFEVKGGDLWQQIGFRQEESWEGTTSPPQKYIDYIRH